MESRIPVPTDNIFKFYALFGLLLFVFACGAVLYENQSTNEVLFSVIPEVEGLKHATQPSAAETAKLAVLQRRIEIIKSDKQFTTNCCAVLICIAIGAMYIGFLKWHTQVQPLLDRTTKVQLELAELQLAKLRREVNGQSASSGSGARPE